MQVQIFLLELQNLGWKTQGRGIHVDSAFAQWIGTRCLKMPQGWHNAKVDNLIPSSKSAKMSKKNCQKLGNIKLCNTSAVIGHFLSPE